VLGLLTVDAEPVTLGAYDQRAAPIGKDDWLTLHAHLPTWARTFSTPVVKFKAWLFELTLAHCRQGQHS
jgi:hypothetical protein